MSNESVLEKPMRSLWLKEGIDVTLSPLAANEQTDVLIAGAGISGITAAYLLKKQGMDVVLIDKNAPLSLATGNTTAKFTFQHDLIYHNILDNYGLEPAKYYYKAQNEGLELVKEIIHELNIDCDYRETYACVYAKNEDEIETLKKEQRAYEKLNIDSELFYADPHNLGYTAALRVDKQFELNPVKYLSFMLKHLLEQNVRIYKDTMALDIKGEGPYTVETKSGHPIKTDRVIIATGYPFFEANSLYFSRLEPLRSYLTAYVVENTKAGDGMFISVDKRASYSVRFSETDGQEYLLVGGQGHPVGQKDSELEDYKSLFAFASKHFNVSGAAYRWSAQDYKTVDEIPFIGPISSNYPDVYVATGYNKWGMSNGSFAAMLITSMIDEKNTGKDEILDQEDKNKYHQLFNPSRGEVSENMGGFLKMNLNVGKEMVKSKFAASDLELSDLKSNQGAIIKKDGDKLAAFKEASGAVSTHSATCTHMGCDLKYNNAEKSFDCPCHGSRFSPSGQVIEGPALKDLEKNK